MLVNSFISTGANCNQLVSLNTIDSKDLCNFFRGFLLNVLLFIIGCSHTALQSNEHERRLHCDTYLLCKNRPSRKGTESMFLRGQITDRWVSSGQNEGEGLGAIVNELDYDVRDLHILRFYFLHNSRRPLAGENSVDPPLRQKSRNTAKSHTSRSVAWARWTIKPPPTSTMVMKRFFTRRYSG